MHLLGAKVATARTEFVSVSVHQGIPAVREIVHAIAKEVFDNQLVASIHRTEVLGDEAAAIRAVVIVPATSDNHAI